MFEVGWFIFIWLIYWAHLLLISLFDILFVLLISVLMQISFPFLLVRGFLWLPVGWLCTAWVVFPKCPYHRHAALFCLYFVLFYFCFFLKIPELCGIILLLMFFVFSVFVFWLSHSVCLYGCVGVYTCQPLYFVSVVILCIFLCYSLCTRVFNVATVLLWCSFCLLFWFDTSCCAGKSEDVLEFCQLQ